MTMKHSDRKSLVRQQRFQTACLESMERRVLLSGTLTAALLEGSLKPLTAHLPESILPLSSVPVKTSSKKKTAKKTTVQTSLDGATTPTTGLTPAQMVGAYLGTNFNFYGITGNGAGETIAIVDAYDQPGFVNSTASNFATSDLAKFDAAYNLPNPPSFTKYGIVYGSSGYQVTTTLPGDDVKFNGSNFSWEMEESLDVEWAHAMAPAANIDLIEATNSSSIFGGVKAADNLPGVNVISMSWSTAENGLGSSGAESQYDATYFSVPTITYLSAAADYGAFAGGTSTISPQYPATSNNVLAVGGTTLTVSGTSWAGETTWGNGTSSGTSTGGGGGQSLYESTPSYQTMHTALYPTGVNTSTLRDYPDVSLDGNPNTGVTICDSFDFGNATPFFTGTVGGTSLATPLMAGIVAVVDQGRALDNLLPLNSNGLGGDADIHTLLYSLAGSSTSYAADFHDITTGNATGPAGAAPSGFSPETGYDLATGLGTPMAGTLVFDLTGISGTPAISQPAMTSVYFKLDSNATYTDIWVNAATPGTGTPTYQFQTADISSYTVTGGNIAITFANVPVASLTLGTGTDSLVVSGGAITVTPQTRGGGILVRNFSSISVASGSSLIFSTAALHTDRTLVETSSLSLLGQLDLGGNDMIIHNGNLSAITALLASGYASGQWNGQGIASSAAHGDTTHTTALGAIQNTLYGGNGQPLFDNASPVSSDVLIKYTYYGDTNLDGKVDGTDYARVDNAYLFGGTGWYNGDFNYDNHLNGSDYTLIDNAFNMQGSSM